MGGEVVIGIHGSEVKGMEEELVVIGMRKARSMGQWAIGMEEGEVNDMEDKDLVCEWELVGL